MFFYRYSEAVGLNACLFTSKGFDLANGLVTIFHVLVRPIFFG